MLNFSQHIGGAHMQIAVDYSRKPSWDWDTKIWTRLHGIHVFETKISSHPDFSGQISILTEKISTIALSENRANDDDVVLNFIGFTGPDFFEGVARYLDERVLEEMLANPNLIPAEWEGRKRIWFLGTKYRGYGTLEQPSPGGMGITMSDYDGLYIPCLSQKDGRWEREYRLASEHYIGEADFAACLLE